MRHSNEAIVKADALKYAGRLWVKDSVPRPLFVAAVFNWEEYQLIIFADFSVFVSSRHLSADPTLAIDLGLDLQSSMKHAEQRVITLLSEARAQQKRVSDAAGGNHDKS